jgi:predicted ribosomally synthesized peptide with nif11-like leader
MTREAAGAALDRLDTDEGFARRVKDAGSVEGSLAVLREAGFEVTPEEMRDATVERHGDQLTPEQLDVISGGNQASDIRDGLIFAGGALAGTVVAGAASAAAAAV